MTDGDGWDKSVIPNNLRQRQLLLEAAIATPIDCRRGTRNCGAIRPDPLPRHQPGSYRESALAFGVGNVDVRWIA